MAHAPRSHAVNKFEISFGDRAKVSGALSDYNLELLEFQDVRPFSLSDDPSENIVAIAAELEESRNPNHVRYATFHTFPRVM